MSSNILNHICIKSLKEFEDFSKQVEYVRGKLSFFNFTNEKQGTISSNTKYEYLVEIYKSLSTYVKVGLYILVILISLIGNLMIIFVILFNRFMRKSTNYFILNLAICNLGILFSCVWVQILLTLTKFWVLGEFYCKLNSYLQMVTITASVLTLSLMLLDRYIGIMHPLRTNFRITNQKCFYLIQAIWVVSLILSIPTFVYRTYSERRWSDFIERYCDDLGWPIHLVKDPENNCVVFITRPFKRIYYTTAILLLFFLPILIMFITYSIIINKLWSNGFIGEINSSSLEIINKKRKKIIKMLLCIMASFFVCWIPLESMLLYMEYTKTFPVWWMDIEWFCYFIAYSNTAINPYIYAGLSENYKNGFRRLKAKMVHGSSQFKNLNRNKFNNQSPFNNLQMSALLSHEA